MTTRLKRWSLLFILLLALIVALLALLVSRLRSDPIALSEANAGLAFTSDRDGTWDVFYLTPDGTVSNLSRGEAGQHDYFPSWSLDGRAINFLSSRSGEMGPAQIRIGQAGVRLLSPVQALTQMMSEGLVDWDPAWAPDGQGLVYASLANGLAINLDLYRLAEDSAEPQRLTRDGPAGPTDWFVAWAPQADRIVYNSNRAGSEDLYLMDISTQTITPLMTDAADQVHGMWSLDGQTLMFVSEAQNPLENGRPDFYLINTDGTNLRPLGDEIFRGDPVYSANGEQFVYISNEEGRWNIYLSDRAGEQVRRLTDNESNALFPVWRPIPKTSEAEG